jgi:hypothetical protein
VADDGEHTGGMIALIPDNPGAFTVPGGDPQGVIHCTLVFLGDDVTSLDPKIVEGLRGGVARMATQIGPIIVPVLGPALWNRDGGPDGTFEPCTVTTLTTVPELADANQWAQDLARAVMGEALFPDQHIPFQPHVTAGYELPDTVLPTAQGAQTFGTLRLALAGQDFDYPLTGEVGDPTVSPQFAGKDTAEMATKTVVKAPKAEPNMEVSVDPDTGVLNLHWPCLVIEGMETGDGRFIPYGTLGARGLPLTVSGQTIRNDGHKGAVAFGKMTKLERHEGPTRTSKETGQPFPEGTAIWEAWGEGDPNSEPGKLALKGYLTGNSADLADLTLDEELADEDGRPVVHMRGAKIAGTTLVPIPAFADGYVEVNGEIRPHDPAIEPLVAAAEKAPAWSVMAGEFGLAEPPAQTNDSAETPFRPPLALFQPKQFMRLTPLTMEDMGDGVLHVYGHVADRSRPHISFSGREVYAPRSRSDYGFFNTGAVRCLDAEGTERVAAVGRLTIGGGHPVLSMSAEETTRLYDDASTAWAWVAASDDQFGVAVSGVVIPGTPDETITKALAHPQSCDWRPIDGHLELVAAHCVNTAGIPTPRARVACGEVVALVAAGAVRPSSAFSGGVDLDALAERIVTRLAPLLASAPEPDTTQQALALELEQITLAGELVTPFDLANPAGEFNWVEKAGGLPGYIKRIVKHLQEKGMDESRAIATAVNVAKKMCATGDTNWPGKQQVNPGSQAEACAAVARWEAMKAAH